MIVQCEHCSTRFQLADERVPAHGIRVRCSRCKHAFFLQPPDASGDAVHAAAEEAALSGGAPQATRDLPERSRVAEADDEESDWEFNQELPGEREPGPEPQAEPEPEPPAAPEPDPGDSAVGSEPSPSVRPTAGAGDPEVSFGTSDDMSDWTAGQGEEPAGEQALESVPDLGADVGHAEAEPADELGDPENWDFFGDDGPAVAAAASSAPTLTPADREPTQTNDLLDDVVGPAMDAPSAEQREPGVVGRALRRSAHVAGWLATAALLAYGLYHGLAPTLRAASPSAVAVGPLQAGSLELRWVETARAGRLLAVRGVLSNPRGPRGVSAAGWEVVLVDEAGRPLAGEPLAAPLPERLLREASPEVLGGQRRAAAARFARTPLAPGEQVRFEAVFADVPLEAARMQLQQRRTTAGAAAPVASVEPPQRTPEAAVAEEATDAAATDAGATERP